MSKIGYKCYLYENNSFKNLDKKKVNELKYKSNATNIIYLEKLP